jgi:hypothetical protein
MPAIPVMPQGARHPQELRALLGQQGIFERGDHIYIQTPVQMYRPTQEQVEEFAFSKQVKSNAPNENLVWLKGQYVEADNANGNGAMWKAQELAIKSLTPMLMPVTVMHDPRTAVGTIADVKMLTPEKDGVPRARIDTVLALWGHRFPEAIHEAEANASQGTLMQSMECYSPWYECSECGQVFHKLPRGAEQAQWCAHLRASDPSGGYTDLGTGGGAQSSNASRILGDVCFTGTGLIFGSRGAKGAYSEAFLENFEDDLAQFHQAAHTSTATPPRSHNMSLVQIEDTELATLRQERDTAKSETAQEREKRQEAERAAEAAEAAKVAAESERDAAKAEVTQKNEELARTQLKEQRLGALGDGFTGKLGEFTSTRLNEQAGTLADAEWEDRLKELEEVTAVKRDAKKDGAAAPPSGGNGNGDGNGEGGDTFGRDELARLGFGTGQPAQTGAVSSVERNSVVTSLAGAFKKPAAKQS